MKVAKIVSERPGLSEEKAKEIWDAFEKFGGYGFNKSHSAAYATISYQSMYMKVHHPAEFFAAALSILGEDKHQAIVKDAATYGVRVMPPDVNISSGRIEIGKLPSGQIALFAPFSSVKGCSDNGCAAIVNARQKVGGKFETYEQFEMAVEKRACNARIREGLMRVGAFASIQPGTSPADAEDRKKDQAELMGSLFTGTVKIGRVFESTPRKTAELSVLMEEMRSKLGLGESMVTPYIGLKPKVMIILNNANGSDAKSGIFMNKGYEDFKGRIANTLGLRMDDLYVTGVMKRAKGKDEQYTKDEEEVFIEGMRREIEIMNPTYILACGAYASRLFNEKDKMGDLTGRKEYFADKDFTVFHAFTPGVLHFRPEEGEKLDEILKDLCDAIEG